MTQPPPSHLPSDTNTAAPAPLAELRGVATGRGLPPLQDVNFVLQPGEAWLISGPNGGGKSTFLKLLRGELSPIRGSRRYLLDGQERTSAVRARQALALISPEQEAFYLTRDWAQTVSDVLLSGLSGDALRLWEAEAEALTRRDEVAAQLKLGELLERDFRTLSHGQRRRALLGRALMSRPAAILLDEFTDGLSVNARAELRGVLEALWRGGLAMVLVTHRPEEAPHLKWRHARVEAGRLTLDAAPPTTMPRPHSFSLPAPTTTGQVLVHLEQAEVYRNGHHALGPLSWTWREGQHWLVTGENGSGKSTLARLIAGAFHPALGGSVTRPFLRRDLLSERQRQIGLISAEVAIRQRRGWTGREVIGSAFGGTEGFSHPLTPGERRDVELYRAQTVNRPEFNGAVDGKNPGNLTVLGENGGIEVMVGGEALTPVIDIEGLHLVLSARFIDRIVSLTPRHNTNIHDQQKLQHLATIVLKNVGDAVAVSECLKLADRGHQFFKFGKVSMECWLQLAERLGASDLLERPADTLSQGQLRRLLLARALVHRPRLLILDEGLDFLDAASRAEVMTLLTERMRGGTSLLVIAHRQEDAPPGLTHHLRLEAGGKIVEGET